MNFLNCSAGSSRTRIAKATVAFFIFWVPAWAQIDTSKLGSDELFQIAREQAFGGARDNARRLLRMALSKSPAYHDVRVFLARTYAWDGKRDSARAELQFVLSRDPSFRDAHSALIDVELWDERPERALAAANEALRFYSTDQEFLLKKARALKNANLDLEALDVLNKLEDLDPSAPGIEDLRAAISSRTLNNSIGASYSTDRFSDIYDPIHYAYVQYGRRTQIGSVFARLNYTRRFESNGVQAEIDCYPRIADGMYAYLNYGYSRADVFPRHRAGGEFYTSLLSSTEGSIGFRYLYFGPESRVTMYTGTFGLYYRSYWFSLRPYITPKTVGLSTSASMTIRYYTGDSDDYLSLRAGAGFTPDERAIPSSTTYAGKEIFHLKSQTVSLGWQQSFGIPYLLFATFDFTNQELSFDPGQYVKMYSVTLGGKVKF